ncbi:hypothetical protein LTR56_008640 [Elasticomyces elasticus]|nr:hypothetical protein LTR56_008640 [Elasticomyces elasticus]KAK3662246.1 hypothetical protein LTR22_007011 [Elasticomyces elasticus]KAK4916729.1 hypothetical protein LTR49_015297 [Elasticomyces elasticus]KAK5768009.1 hypothetical protein LTS12_001826 [Elasticomyces elasticus]
MAAAGTDYKPEGRLGDDSMTLGTDPRTNRKLLHVLKGMGMDARQPAPVLTMSSPMEDITAFIGQNDTAFQGMYDMLPNDLPGDKDEPKVDHSTKTIKGVDGNDIAIHIFRKAVTEGETLPALVYTHGGGMTIINTINPVHVRLLTSLALSGLVAIAVDFRNAYTKEGHNPFPAGLNDCAAGVQYVAAHKSELGIGKITIQGESGGGNLAIATTLKAKKEGWLDAIDGTYASIPYISNAWGWPEEKLLKELPSVVASNEYFLSRKMNTLMGHYYTPNEKDSTNPLAWPYHATVEELKGLPPFYVAVDELDPLRDEGMAFYHKLSAAGVDVAAHMNLGVAHGSWGIFRQAIPEFFDAAVASIAAFAKRV